jgi:uncharacterized membrane protein
MTDDLIERVAHYVFWPLEFAAGRNVVIRIFAVTIGCLYILPMAAFVLIPVVFLNIMMFLWRDLRDG